MKPKYSASLTIVTSRFIKGNFAQPLGQETLNKLIDLNRYQDVTLSYGGNCLRVFLTPIWDVEDVLEEIITVLESESFEKSKILVVDET